MVETTATSENNCDGGNNCYAVWSNLVGNFACTCIDEYIGDGSECTDINQCFNGNNECGSSVSCTNTDKSYSCHCDTGYIVTGFVTAKTSTNVLTTAAPLLSEGITPVVFECTCNWASRDTLETFNIKITKMSKDTLFRAE